MIDAHSAPLESASYVTVVVAERSFALPIAEVHDVFKPTAITPVPLAPHRIVGLINLRGRVVTAISLRRILHLPDAQPDAPVMAVGLESNGDTFALVVDAVGDVMELGPDSFEPTPANLDERISVLTTCLHRLPGKLLTVLDVERLLRSSTIAEAA